MMVFASRLKDSFFKLPTHGPVHTPSQLYTRSLANIGSFRVTTFCTMVGKAILTIIAIDYSGVTIAFFTKDGSWPIFFFSRNLMGIISIAIQTFLDFVPVLQGNLHPLIVHMGAITLCLIQELRMNTYNRKG